jgi:hypothetical protein
MIAPLKRLLTLAARTLIATSLTEGQDEPASEPAPVNHFSD